MKLTGTTLKEVISEIEAKGSHLEEIEIDSLLSGYIHKTERHNTPLFGNRLNKFEYEEPLVGTRHFTTPELLRTKVIGRKKFPQDMEFSIKGTKDITPIIIALGLLDEDEQM